MKQWLEEGKQHWLSNTNKSKVAGKFEDCYVFYSCPFIMLHNADHMHVAHF
jgi:hypothetical protein